MAEGRMIIKDISYDSRIWAMSDKARELWPYIIPHTEADGSLPRSARSLRLMCFPAANVTNSDVEAVILEWLSVKTEDRPQPVCRESGNRLILNDFEEANKNMSFFKMRRKRGAEGIGHSDQCESQ